jgi:dihydrofolate reductase
MITCDLSVSVDGFVTGPNQRLDAPFGDGIGERLHTWMFATPDENAAEIAAITTAGAYVMGRNMFTPGRGDWDLDWTGWWGPEPPYHAPVFVLTHHPRESVEMAGGTTFHFVTGGFDEAVRRAVEAAGEKNVSIAGGAATVNQALSAGVIDELRLHITPLVQGRGERLFDGVGELELTPVSTRCTPLVTHVTYRMAAAPRAGG